MDEHTAIGPEVPTDVAQDEQKDLPPNLELKKSLDNLDEGLHIHSMLSALDSVHDVVIICNLRSQIIYINNKAEQLLKIKKENILGKDFDHVITLYNKLDMPSYLSPVQVCINEKRIIKQQSEAKLLTTDGSQVLVEYVVAPVFENSTLKSVVLVLQDKTNDHITRRQLEYIIQHDPLTNLYNRNYFEHQLNHAVNISKRGLRTHAMLYIDINQFKVINDTAGHSVGDELLCEVSAILQQRIRECDLLARLGSDEFGILLNDVDSLGAVHMADDLINAMSSLTFIRSGNYYDINISIGITLVDNQSNNTEGIFRQADIACTVAKQYGQNGCHLYSDLDNDDIMVRDELYLVNELQTIISEDRFKMFFQPIIDPRSGEVLLHETLLRIVDKDNSIRPSSSFIETAERFSMMDKIDRRVIESTLNNIKYLSSKHGDISVSMNLSAVSIGNQDLLIDIKHLIISSGVNPAQIVFEITESSAVSQIESARFFIKGLKEIGCKFALDDFGTGFSSFAYLKYLPVDYLKIDGTFIRDIINDKVDQAMVKSMHHIAKSLNIKTIAEYVENEATLKLLAAMGIDYVQGNHIGVAAAELNFG
ncbi:diguanylate cyclase/phosphodiesterase (GGDEF & EAL domains) with PAS/PAC sensor(s) [hydrothermal vent metagenome]|uniref:Diguanylate cyclase/phosphodiesterase (GGDEF & EAL domains) with PAS/PAC sensor(S) n=1 Tax=hydrothermal vent metagenome TaxID=652676 RepID=A0A3B0ZVX9_9ZZZZ